MILLIIEGMFIGMLLGLTGAGGGILAVPALMASQGWTVAEAAPVGLIAVTISAMLGTLQGLIQKNVRYRAAIWIALLAIPFAHIGVYFSQVVPKTYLTVLFALVMCVVAFRLFFGQNVEQPNPMCRLNPNTGRFVWNKKTAFIFGFIGIIAGFLTGLLGVGGGFLIVPALKKTTNLNLNSIVCTSLMIIFLVGATTIGLHLLDGFCYPAKVTSIFVGSCIGGLLIGKQLLSKISPLWVQKTFAITVMCVACVLLYKSLINN